MKKGRNNPSLERAIQIANVLGCTLDELVDTERYLNEYHDMLKELSDK